MNIKRRNWTRVDIYGLQDSLSFYLKITEDIFLHDPSIFTAADLHPSSEQHIIIPPRESIQWAAAWMTIKMQGLKMPPQVNPCLWYWPRYMARVQAAATTVTITG